MSTVTETMSWATSAPTTAAQERLPNRFTGIVIAVGASLVLWSGIGAGLWALVDIVG